MYASSNPRAATQSPSSPFANDSRARSAERYSPRQPGTGYGNSSGYASPRSYATEQAAPMFRCG